MAGLSEDQINWHPAEGAWSIAECIAHLNKANSLYIPNLEAGFAHARQMQWFARGGNVRAGFLERWFANRQEPPYRLRVKAPAKFRPSAGRYERDAILAQWVAIHQRLLELIRSDSDLDWNKVKIVSPVASWLKISAIGVFAIIAAHDRRHLWQAEQIREKLFVR